MNSIAETLVSNLKEWQDLCISDRDKIIANALFDVKDKNIPMFSSNIVNIGDTQKLVDRIDMLGVCFAVEQLPRSTLSIVTVEGVALPPMPAHKAIAFIAFLIARKVIIPKTNILEFKNAN